MLVSKLEFSNVRNISSATLDLHPKLTIISGENGAGKTSIVEALHILATGRSFRTRHIDKIIQTDQTELTSYAQIQTTTEGIFNKIGLKKDNKGEFLARINGKTSKTISEITKLLPMMVLTPSTYDDLLTSRLSRLKFCDWGVFHVEPKFHKEWLEFNKILKQRNALLKQIVSRNMDRNTPDLDYWTKLLVEKSMRLGEYRKNYVYLLSKTFEELKKDLPLNGRVSIQFFPGWSEKQPLEKLLMDSKERDLRTGTTYYGAHKADLKILFEDSPAVDKASRGQQKMIVTSLILSAIQLYGLKSEKTCFLAIDDIASELDDSNQDILLAFLMSLPRVQLLITCITSDSLHKDISGYNKRLFHVEHGNVRCIHQ